MEEKKSMLIRISGQVLKDALKIREIKEQALGKPLSVAAVVHEAIIAHRKQIAEEAIE